MVRITDYLRSFGLNFLIDFINEYEDARCALAEEALFDLRNYDDYYLFADVYELDRARVCQRENRLWWGGANFPTPQPIEEEIKTLLEWIDKSVDEAYIFQYPELFDRYMRVADLSQDVAKETESI